MKNSIKTDFTKLAFIKALDNKDAQLEAKEEEIEALRGMKVSFENSKRLYEKYASDIDNPQGAWIYKTCCDVLRQFNETQPKPDGEQV